MTSMKLPLKMPQPSLPIVLALFSIYVVWGATNLGTSFASESYPPFMAVALRLFFALFILLGILKGRGIPFPALNQMLNAAFIGALMFGGRSGLLAFAQQQDLGSGMMSLGVATVPLWAMFFAFIFGYRPGKLELVGLAIGMFGMVILNMGSDMQAQPLGAIVLLFAPMVWAFGAMYSKELTMPDGFMSTVFQMIGGCVTLFVMSLLQGEQFPTAPTAQATAALIILSIGGTLIAFSAFMYLVQHVSPGLATSYAYVNPVVAAVFAVIFFEQSMPPTGILAMLVIGAGVAFVMIGKSRTS